jgi:hypothetical protein
MRHMGRIGPMELILLLLLVSLPIMAILIILGWVRAVARRGAERRQREQAARERSGQGPHVIEREREHVIERQVLVVRCRFCQKLTPADLSACKECGARQ